MGLFDGFRTRTKKRLAREAENWRAPRTMAGQNIGVVEAIYYALVLIAALAASGLAQKSSAVQVVVFGLAVVCLSAHVRRVAIPALYDAVGPKFGWPPFRQAIQEELAASGEKAAVETTPAAAAASLQPLKAEEPSPEPIQPAEPAQPTQKAGGDVTGILEAYAALPKQQRRTRTAQVLAHLKANFGLAFPEVDEEEDEQAKCIVGDSALMALASKERVA